MYPKRLRFESENSWNYLDVYSGSFIRLIPLKYVFQVEYLFQSTVLGIALNIELGVKISQFTINMTSTEH